MHAKQLHAAQFFDDNSRLLLHEAQNIQIVNPNTGQVVLELPQVGPWGALRISPDGRRLAKAEGLGLVIIQLTVD